MVLQGLVSTISTWLKRPYMTLFRPATWTCPYPSTQYAHAPASAPVVVANTAPLYHYKLPVTNGQGFNTRALRTDAFENHNIHVLIKQIMHATRHYPASMEHPRVVSPQCPNLPSNVTRVAAITCKNVDQNAIVIQGQHWLKTRLIQAFGPMILSLFGGDASSIIAHE